MNRRLFSFALLVLFSLIGITPARADDLKAMEGTWRVVAAEAGGQPVDSDDLKALVATIMGDHFTVKTRESMEGGTLKLDETQNPRTMDATKTEGFEAGKVTRAIYELMGDTLRVCYALDGGERPNELATKEGLPWLLVTYQREK